MDGCLFCKIISKEIRSRAEHETGRVYAFHDINPQAPFHVLVVPKKHIAKVGEAADSDREILGDLLLEARNIAEKNKWADYRLVVNNGAGAGQTVFHIHVHILAGRPMTWPPG